MNIVHEMPNRQPVALTPVFDMPLDAGFMRGTEIQDVSPSQIHGAAVGTVGLPVFANPGMDFISANAHKIVALGGADITGPTSVSTVSLWVTAASLVTDLGIFRINTSDWLQIESGVLNISGWAGGTAILYLDGQVATDGVTTLTDTGFHCIAITDTVAKNANAMRIGKRGAATNHEGKIGDFRMYAEVLTPGQIQSIFNVQRYKYGV